MDKEPAKFEMGINPLVSIKAKQSRMKKVFFVLVVAMLAISEPSALLANCKDNQLEVKGDWGMVRFRVEIADTPESHNRGLMGRESLGLSQGMFFVFEKPGPANFWMKDTLIPLDMIFIDETGQITTINHQAEPLTTTTFFGGNAISFVLEINGGLAKKLGISEGDLVRHPRINHDLAAWACKS